MEQLLTRLKAAHPKIKFCGGEAFSWSPSTSSVTYKTAGNDQLNQWALLHEVAHAILKHKKYDTDFELLLLEVAAWQKAKELGVQEQIDIDEDHVQDCIDTYRDWLYQRSNCPTCGNTSLQQNAVTYRCFNCDGSWTVTASRFCRPYRLSSPKTKTQAEAPESTGTTFL